MKTSIIFFTLLMALNVFAGNAFASEPTATSPDGVAPVVEDTCPPFVWSGAAGAVAYKVEVFRSETEGVPSYEEMNALVDPVLRQEMSAASLSWRPPSGGCLESKTAYIWYVQAIDCDGNGSWSVGKGFSLEEQTIHDSKSRLTEDISNTYVGYEAGNSNTTGVYNTFGGVQAGYSNTVAHYNTFFGYNAGYSNTTGTNNTFIGHFTGRNNDGDYNSFYGAHCGNSNTIGSFNTLTGYRAGYSNTTGSANTFVGFQAGYSNTTGRINSFIGYEAGYNNTTGLFNTFLGTSAGYSNTEGYGNVFLGYQAGYNETGSRKLYIHNSDTTSPLVYGEFDNRSLQINGNLKCTSTLLTNNASAWGSAPFVLGQDKLNRGMIITDKAASNQKNIYFGWNVGATHEYAEIFALQEGVAYKNLILNPNGAYLGIGTTSPAYPLHMGSGAYVSTGGAWTNASSREYKTDIKKLSTQKAIDTLKQLDPVEFAYKTDSREKHVGFIAEDAPELVASKDKKGMSSMDVVAVLTKVVQEQQRVISEMNEKIVQLQAGARLNKTP